MTILWVIWQIPGLRKDVYDNDMEAWSGKARRNKSNLAVWPR